MEQQQLRGEIKKQNNDQIFWYLNIRYGFFTAFQLKIDVFFIKKVICIVYFFY